MIIFYVKIGGAKNIKIERYKIYSEYDSLKSTFCILERKKFFFAKKIECLGLI